MKLSYYDKFKCTADKCPITCCQEWKISVDEDTRQQWSKMGLGYAITTKDGDKVIKLNKMRNCPFLSDNKLCSLVIKQGEEFIPHTCHVFPRQTHFFENRKEEALVSCCPEVINLLNETDINEMVGELLLETKDFLFNLRNLVIKELVNSPNASIAMKKCFFMLLECIEKYEVQGEVDLKQYNTVYFSEVDVAVRLVPVDMGLVIEEVNELFLDIVENYRKQGIYKKYIDDIAKVAEEISSGKYKGDLLKEYNKFLKKIEPYKELFIKYLVSEFFADGLLPDSDIYEFVMSYQWFAMEYAIIRHCVFLRTIVNDLDVEYPDVSEFMVIISRIMGYNKEDIYEYMGECFNDSIWQWGYLALIMGEN